MSTVCETFPSAIELDAPVESNRAAREMSTAIGICLGFFMVSQLGLISGYDGVVYVAAVSLMFVRWCPALLILLASTHDAPGLAYPAVYISFLQVFSVLVVANLLNWQHQAGLARRFVMAMQAAQIMLPAALLVVYGVLISLTNRLPADFHDGSDPGPLTLAFLMLTMVAGGFLASYQVAGDPVARERISVVAWCCLAHILLVSVMQVFFGVAAGHSPGFADDMSEFEQLSEASSLGIARLTGPLLTPNAVALVPAYLTILILLCSKKRELTLGFCLTYCVVGNFEAVLGAARNMMAYFFLTSAALTWRTSRLAALGMVAIVLGAVACIQFDVQSVEEFMRVDEGYELGVRGLAWEAVIDNFTVWDWLLGSWMGHWRAFFEEYAGFSMSDPHCWILSALGTFGVAGLAFYGYLIWSLGTTGRREDVKSRLAAFFLIAMLLGKDLTSTQYLFNQNTISYLIWLSVGLIFMQIPESAVEELSGADSSSSEVTPT